MTAYYIIDRVKRLAAPDYYRCIEEAAWEALSFPAGFVAAALTDEQAAEIFNADTGFNTDF